MDKNNLNDSSESKYLLNFSFLQKRLSSKDEDYILDPKAYSKSCMSSNVISETSLEEDYILLKKKSLLKRKSMGSLKIFYSEIIDLKLNKSDLSSLYSSIVIVYSKNGYKSEILKSNEENYLNDRDGNLEISEKLDDFMKQMNAEISEKRKKKISKQMKFDRCSSGEY